MTALPTAFKSISLRSRRRRWVLVLLIVAFVSLGALVYSHGQKRIKVETASPEYQDIESTISATGQVVPVHDFQARAVFAGVVDKIYVQLGEKVAAGQMLVRMKDPYASSRLATARADFDTAEVNYDNLQHNGSREDRINFDADLERAQAERDAAANALSTRRQLLQRGSVSEAEVLAGTQRLQDADAAVRALNEKLHNRYSRDDLTSWKARVDAQKSVVTAERVAWSNANVSSPVSGTVYIMPVSMYDFVNPGTDLLHVADLSQLKVKATFFEPEIGHLALGQPVRITWDGAFGHIWNGHVIARPLAVTHSGTIGTGECTIALDDVTNDLPPNSTVTATVLVERHSHVLTIPREALQTRGASHFVYRVIDGRLTETLIDIGVLNPFRVEVTRGLTARDVIALRAHDSETLSNNRRVTTSE